MHPSSSGTTPATPKKGENGYFLPEKSLRPVCIEGITVEGILQQMQLAYQTTQPVGTKDPVGVHRWRKLLNSKPDKFLAILESQEKRFESSQSQQRLMPPSSNVGSWQRRNSRPNCRPPSSVWPNW